MPEPSARSNVPATAAALAVMGFIAFAGYLVVPGQYLNGGMWLFLFSIDVAYAFYLWQQPAYRETTARQWAGQAALFALGFGIFWAAGIGFAYSRGVRDGSNLLFDNGGFFLAVTLGMPLVLAAIGGGIRALVLKTGPAYAAMTVNERLAHFDLFTQFDAAVRARDKAAVMRVLMKARFTSEQAENTASTLLRSPERYGF